MAVSLHLAPGRKDQARALRTWALGLLISPLGWLLYELAAEPRWTSVSIVGKALVASGMVLYLRALILLHPFERRPDQRWLYWIPAVIVLASLGHSLLWPERLLGSGLLSLLCGGLALACAMNAVRLDRIADSTTHGQILALNFCVVSLLSMLRAALLLLPPDTLFAPPVAEVLSQHWLVALIILAPIVGTVNLALIERDGPFGQSRRDLDGGPLLCRIVMSWCLSLTGVATRAHVLDLLDREFTDAVSERRGLAVLVIDIDHFKTINDSHGHEAGDQTLRQVSAIIRAALPSKADLGRIGGEEFLIILPGAALADALELAERVRRDVARQPIIHSKQVLGVTVSIGCAVRMAEDQQMSELIRRGDQAMYAAKDAGRNRVSQVYRALRSVDARKSPLDLEAQG